MLGGWDREGKGANKRCAIGQVTAVGSRGAFPPGDLREGVSDGLGTAPPEGQGKRIIDS